MKYIAGAYMFIFPNIFALGLGDQYLKFNPALL